VDEVARTREWLASQRTAAPASGTDGSLSIPASGGATVVRICMRSLLRIGPLTRLLCLAARSPRHDAEQRWRQRRRRRHGEQHGHVRCSRLAGPGWRSARVRRLRRGSSRSRRARQQRGRHDRPRLGPGEQRAPAAAPAAGRARAARSLAANRSKRRLAAPRAAACYC
jgi:hypothetical protein